MKPIKRVVLKDAKLLSTDEMKHLFGGNGNLTISQLINHTSDKNGDKYISQPYCLIEIS